MKRLNCTYEVKQDPVYPWLLKHPKIKSGLAKFKTRQEALEWYTLLQFETAIWFQNDKRIFAGQLASDFEDNTWSYYIKVAGFDGGATYEGMCEELSINPRTFEFDSKKVAKKLKNLDFILLHDPYTYFPEELEIAKRSRKEMVDLELVNKLKNEYEEKIKGLEKELQNKEEETAEIELLKSELSEKNNEIIVIKETAKQYESKLQPVSFVEFKKLEEAKQLDALALYLSKLKRINEDLKSQTIPVVDYNRIFDNFEALDVQLDKAQKKASEENSKLFEQVKTKLKDEEADLLRKLKIDEKLADTPDKFAYYKDEEKAQKVSVAYETSFVLMELEHVGFVSKGKYAYPVDYLVEPAKYAVAIVGADEHVGQSATQMHQKQEKPVETKVAPEVKEAKKEVVEEKPIKEEKPVAKAQKVEEKPAETKKPLVIKEAIITSFRPKLYDPIKEDMVTSYAPKLSDAKVEEFKGIKENMVTSYAPKLYNPIKEDLADSEYTAKATEECTSCESEKEQEKEEIKVAEAPKATEEPAKADEVVDEVAEVASKPESSSVASEIVVGTVANNCKPMPEFWTGKDFVPTSVAYVDEKQIVEETSSDQRFLTNKWYKFFIILLVLILIGLVVINILAILQLAGVQNFFPVY